MTPTFERIAQLPQYVLAAVDEEKDALRKRGVDVYDFGLGNPDGVAPPLAVEALIQEVQRTPSHRYQPSRGIAELREAIARWYGRSYDVKLDPDREAICALGSKEAIGHFLLAAISPGDAAIVPDPRYPLHAAGVAIAGGTIVPYPVGPGRDPLQDIAHAYEGAP